MILVSLSPLSTIHNTEPDRTDHVQISEESEEGFDTDLEASAESAASSDNPLESPSAVKLFFMRHFGPSYVSARVKLFRLLTYFRGA